MGNMNKNILVTVIIVLAVGAAAFFGGMQYQKAQVTSSVHVGGRQGAGRLGGRPTLGQVISQDSTGFTIKLADGSSKIILVAGSTMFVKTSTASTSDIKTGDKIMVFGTANSDGSTTATNIQINPPQRQAMQPGAK